MYHGGGRLKYQKHRRGTGPPTEVLACGAMRAGRARARGRGRGAGRVAGRGVGRGPGPATSQLPTPPVTVNERHREYRRDVKR